MHRKRSISSGIWENEVVQELSDPAFKTWVGIWSISDRNGIFPWRPRKWALRFAPRNLAEAERLFQELLDGGLVERFEALGEEFGFSVKWARHQDPHIDEPPVYPMPCSPNFVPCPPRHWTKRNAKWMVEVYGIDPHSDAPNTDHTATPGGTGADSGAGPACPSGPSGPPRPSRPSDPSREKISCLGPGEPGLEHKDDVPVLMLPCVGKGPKEFAVTQAMLDSWRDAYPGVDPGLEVKRLRVWLEQAPHKIRSSRHMGSLLSTWLSNAQAKSEHGATITARNEGGARHSKADQEFLERLDAEGGGQ